MWLYCMPLTPACEVCLGNMGQDLKQSVAELKAVVEKLAVK
jgi:hypothetical protein